MIGYLKICDQRNGREKRYLEDGESADMRKISEWTKENIFRRNLVEYTTLKDSILRNGTKINKRKMIISLQTSSRGSLIWCFSTESQRFLRSNTKGADVAYSTYMDTCVTP